MANMNERYERVWKKWEHEDLGRQIIAHRKSRIKYLDLIIKYLAKGNKLKALEVGCGAAIDLHIIAEGCEAEMFGIDISQEAFVIARKIQQYFSKKVYLALGDVRNLEFADDSFDMVFSQGLIEHFETPIYVLREQVRVLKPGGVLIVNVPQKYTVYTLYKHLMALLGRWEWGNEKEYSSGQLKRFGDYLELEFLEKCGYDYWRSLFEIVFILKTLNRKMEKIPFVKDCPGQKTISRFWERSWERLEGLYGHLFMKNVIYVYRKP
ncbi:MAG: methyltransferase domain-containing protein [Candidatus Omnitrophota bacterium]|nr:methyltransferase domain-containing protein [Candidatus Omnitrophota bacterium]